MNQYERRIIAAVREIYMPTSEWSIEDVILAGIKAYHEHEVEPLQQQDVTANRKTHSAAHMQGHGDHVDLRKRLELLESQIGVLMRREKHHHLLIQPGQLVKTGTAIQSASIEAQDPLGRPEEHRDCCEYSAMRADGGPLAGPGEGELFTICGKCFDRSTWLLRHNT